MRTNKFRSYWIIAIAAIFLYSCEIDNDNNVQQEANVQQKDIPQPESQYSLLDFSPNVYHDYFGATENAIGFSSLKQNSLAQHSVVKKFKIEDKPGKAQFSINNRKINPSEPNKSSSVNRTNIYGEKVVFSVMKEVNGKSSQINVELYVPELVEITNPEISSEEELMPYCYSKGFVLEWNEDSRNKEGLVVIVEYFGANAIPSQSTNEHIQNIDVIEEDDGRTILDTALFNNIPDLSLVHIILLRGNVKIEEINGETYKFFAESHQRLPIILVKDLSSVIWE